MISIVSKGLMSINLLHDSVNTLYERAAQGQSIGLIDAEARGCWISITGSILGFSQDLMTTAMMNAAEAGEAISEAAYTMLIALENASSALKGISFIHGFANHVDRMRRNALTYFELFQYSAATLFFFRNTASNSQSASAIIREVQQNVISSHREGLGKDAKIQLN